MHAGVGEGWVITGISLEALPRFEWNSSEQDPGAMRAGEWVTCVPTMKQFPDRLMLHLASPKYLIPSSERFRAGKPVLSLQYWKDTILVILFCVVFGETVSDIQTLCLSRCFQDLWSSEVRRARPLLTVQRQVGPGKGSPGPSLGRLWHHNG